MLADLDDTIVEVHGYAKQGAAFGYSGVRGLSALLAIVSTDQIVFDAWRFHAFFTTTDPAVCDTVTAPTLCTGGTRSSRTSTPT